ncbi:hypothetical protein [Actinomyces urogenitalis]|nr:hypothetical protein [Actinomyces urogenitalis]
MRNPAYEFLELIDSWGGDDTLILRRGGESNDHEDPHFWDQQREAVRLLQEVEQYVRADGLSVEEVLALNDAWIFLFPPRNNWCDAQFAFPTIPNALRGMIRQIGRRIEETSVPVKSFTPEAREGLRETLLEIREEIRVLTELAPEERDRLDQLIGDALRLLDEDAATPESIRAKSCEVVGAVLPVTSHVPEERRPRFFERLLTISGTWLMGFSSGAAANLLAASLETAVTQIGQ